MTETPLPAVRGKLTANRALNDLTWLRVGGAQMSPKHSNFLINADNATAADLENLGEEVRKKVYDSSGIRLEWEIMRLGDF